jgi:8-oxo-dGTP pyrophosphatase MutT (NUDIX family)
MHIGRHIIQELVLALGAPVVERWSFPMQAEEFDLVRAELSRRRAHDVTVAITQGEEVVVIRKTSDPQGGFRLPSGGIHPEEAFLDGTIREAQEETGLRVSVERYLLRVHTVFTRGQEQASWTSHVMQARAVSGEVGPVDTREVASARWMGWQELLSKVNPILIASGRGGLAYRARLQERAREVLVASVSAQGASR